MSWLGMFGLKTLIGLVALVAINGSPIGWKPERSAGHNPESKESLIPEGIAIRPFTVDVEGLGAVPQRAQFIGRNSPIAREGRVDIFGKGISVEVSAVGWTYDRSRDSGKVFDGGQVYGKWEVGQYSRVPLSPLVGRGLSEIRDHEIDFREIVFVDDDRSFIQADISPQLTFAGPFGSFPKPICGDPQPDRGYREHKGKNSDDRIGVFVDKRTETSEPFTNQEKEQGQTFAILLGGFLIWYFAKAFLERPRPPQRERDHQ